MWYLVYRDENNQPHTVKGSTDGIRKALRDRLLGDPSGILVSRQKNGQFVPLHSTPEFRDLVVTPTPMPLPNARQAGPEETSDYDPTPPGPSSGVHRGPRKNPSANHAALPPPPPSGTRPPKPEPMALPDEDEANPFDYNPPAPVSQQTPTPANSPHRDRDRDRGRERDRESDEDRGSRRGDRDKKPFDWTPVLVGLVMVLSAVIGYLIIFKK